MLFNSLWVYHLKLVHTKKMSSNVSYIHWQEKMSMLYYALAMLYCTLATDTGCIKTAGGHHPHIRPLVARDSTAPMQTTQSQKAVKLKWVYIVLRKASFCNRPTILSTSQIFIFLNTGQQSLLDVGFHIILNQVA